LRSPKQQVTGIAHMEKYTVSLLEEEREYLLGLIKKGKSRASTLTYARIFLAIDESSEKVYETDAEIAEQFHISAKFISRARKKFIEEGLKAAISRKPYPKTRIPKIQGNAEAHLIALCCSNPPEGHCRWTLKLLANAMVEMEIVESISPSTIGRTLKKTN